MQKSRKCAAHPAMKTRGASSTPNDSFSERATRMTTSTLTASTLDALFYSATEPRERYDAQRTLRRQQSLYLTTGTVLYSNLGNPMLTIIADTCGRHDTLGGACAQESNTVRYALEKRYMHSCRDNYLRACAHDGRLSKRDLSPNINFFMNVPVTAEGGLTFEDGISGAGKYVELRAEMDVIVLISNCPQLNNPCNAYNPTPAELLIWD